MSLRFTDVYTLWLTTYKKQVYRTRYESPRSSKPKLH